MLPLKLWIRTMTGAALVGVKVRLKCPGVDTPVPRAVASTVPFCETVTNNAFATFGPLGEKSKVTARVERFPGYVKA